MAGLNMKNEMAAAEAEFQLETVKQVTQQVTAFGFENAKDPIFQWRLLMTDGLLVPSKAYSSDFFVINNQIGDLLGHLNLTYLKKDYDWVYNFKISLIVSDSDKKSQRINELNPLQFFVCKMKVIFSGHGAKPSEESYFSMNAFHLNGANENELNFKFDTHHSATNLTVELYQEPLAMIQYIWPYDDMVVGKIEKFYDKMLRYKYDSLLSVSPRFHYGSSHQLMIVTFSKVPNKSNENACGLSATLHILSTGETRGAPLFYAVTFTIFSQQENVKDFVHKVFYRRDENKSAFTTMLAFYQDLKGCYVDGLYYKVVIEPHPSK